MNWPPDAFIYMKVGPHGGEALDEILDRKRGEFKRAGKIFWSYGGFTCHPRTQVNPFVEEWTQRQGSVYVLMERLENPGRLVYGAPAGTATHYSVDCEVWDVIPKEISTAPKRAFVLGEITEVNRELDLRDFLVGIGRSKGENAAKYITNQVDKGCLVAGRSESDHPSKRVTIAYQARLLKPYAVFVRRHIVRGQ